MTAYKTDYVAEALSRLTTDNRGANIQALVTAYIGQKQKLEDGFYGLLDLLTLPSDFSYALALEGADTLATESGESLATES